MPFPVLGSNSAVAGYEIDNSLRGSDSGKLSRTPSSAGNRQTFTISTWVKLSRIEHVFPIYNVGTGVGDDTNFQFRFTGAGKLFIAGGATSYRQTNAQFRDPSAWYHVVMAFDSTNGTADDRIKLWVNGVQETAFDTRTNASQNVTYAYGQSGYYNVGGRSNNTGSAGHYFDGLMSHVHYCDGYAYQASDFGSTDSTTGEWKINTSPSVSYGTNGFWWLKDSIATTDHSPNSNSFTVSGTLTKTEDCPSNVFATFNPIIGLHSNGGALVPTLEAGNTDAWINTTQWRIGQSTLAASSGKYYAEFKQSNDYGTDYAYIGIWDIDAYAQKLTGYPLLSDMANCFGMRSDNGNKYVSATASSYGNSWTTNDIISVAMDLDNSKLYFAKNGTWQNSGVPTSGSTGTGAISITANKTYAMGLQLYNSAYRVNFGNGYFGTTAVSSAGTNASGNGIFEYDVPTGYTALSTKGLNE